MSNLTKFPQIEVEQGAWTVEDEWADEVSSQAMTVVRQAEEWAPYILHGAPMTMAVVEWYAECAISGTILYHSAVTMNPNIRGGRPVLAGTGFTVAQTLAELSESSGVIEVAENFDLDPQTIRDLLDGLSLMFERTYRP